MDYQVQEDYVPIIGYHIVDTETTTTEITINNFRDQVEYLTNTMNCNWITMESLSLYIDNKEKVPTNACIMNFDDGQMTQYHNALCTLNTHKIPATFYIITESIQDSQYYMSWEEVGKLSIIGHDIESHTLTHPHLNLLNYIEQENEILNSKIDLESRGYTVKTLSYPYGDYNDDTLDILRNSDYILGRDTSQDYYWKDKRVPIISFNDDYLLHFYYIKPELLTPVELGNIIEYTGWWQFEDNYKVIYDEDNDIKISTSNIIPTDTSYAVLILTDKYNEISTQFITKYDGSFTLDMLLYNSTETISFSVKVDDVFYDVYSHDYTSQYSLKYTIGIYDYYNFYINIPSLLPGVHTLNIVLNDWEKIYLDKFRLFSNVDQTFHEMPYYKDCNSTIDDYCNCDEGVIPTPTPTLITQADPNCDLGILTGSTCCHIDCEECAGDGCGSRPGGSSNCCGGSISNAGNSCNNQGAPCIVTSSPTPPPILVDPTPPPVDQTQDPNCDLGILTGNTCCHIDCGECGGSGCSSRPGGSSNCCAGNILNDGNSCNDQGAPCIVTSFPTPQPILVDLTADPTCEFGILKSIYCCHIDCGECGGSGCSSRPGGSSNCCAGNILNDGNSCNDQGAPCIIG